MLYDKDHALLHSHFFYNGIMTNNCAEYTALIAALAKTIELYGHENDVRVFSDSTLMVKQITGEYKTKDKGLRALNIKARELVAKFASFGIKNVPRENIYVSAVDRELNRLLDEMEMAKPR